MFWPTLNSSVTSAAPSRAREYMRSTPWSPRSTSSCSLRISRSTSAGAAPGHSVVIMITGSRTSGVSWMGRVASAPRPNTTAMSTAAITAIGRSIASRIRFISALGLRPVSGFRRARIGDRLARAQPLVAAHHHEIARLQPAQDLEPAADRLAQLHRAQRRRRVLDQVDHSTVRLLDDPVLVDRDDPALLADRQLEGHALGDRERLRSRAEARRQADRAGPRQRVLLGHHGPHRGIVRRAVVEQDRDGGTRGQPRDPVARHVDLDLELMIVDQRHDRIAGLDVGAGADVTLAHHTGVRGPDHRVLEVARGPLQLDAVLLDARGSCDDPAARDLDLVL